MDTIRSMAERCEIICPVAKVTNGKYSEFIARKSQLDGDHGFEPLFMPDSLFGFQKHLVEYATRQGRSACFADCGLGKTLMQLVWAQNVVQQTNGAVLVATPLAVSTQTVAEADKFNIEATRNQDGTNITPGIWVTNYERLAHFNPADFSGMVCDESSILKNYDGETKKLITEFMRRLPYRLLCTATAAPNDYHELGTSSECLGQLGYRDMITSFFKQDEGGGLLGWGRPKYRLKGHAENHFWRWVCSWARACRKPSDLGFDDDGFNLPALHEVEHMVECDKPRQGMLFATPAKGLQDQREERRLTIRERCEKVGQLCQHDSPSVCWCHLNDEADLLEQTVQGAKQISGSMPDEQKEERLLAFVNGEITKLVTKPQIGAFGLNWQHCDHVVTFPSHSFEQYYQAVRRCWRFGQKSDVTVDIVTTEGELGTLKNLERKVEAATRMFDSLVAEMNNSLSLSTAENFNQPERMPAWL